MPVTVVVGGQFGSEGKGKVAHYLAKEMSASVAIRCGGTNSGHTVIDPDGNPIIFRQLPTASILPDVICVLCAGCYIDLDVLKREIDISGLDHRRLFIDPKAVIITPEIKNAEILSGLKESIGSTGSGTGEAILRRIQRKEQGVTFAKDVPVLKGFVKDIATFLRNRLDEDERIILEGTQGFGLSLLHSEFYPHVTSRDTTAAGFVSEAGLSPLDVDDVVLTIRAFPIRVAGKSGPLPNEIDWETLTKESNSEEAIVEYTSVSKRIRRIARFDEVIVQRALMANNSSRIVLNHLDYIDCSTRINGLTSKVEEFVKYVNHLLGHNIDFCGFGPSSEQLVQSPYGPLANLIKNG